jgi:hypothetical protein
MLSNDINMITNDIISTQILILFLMSEIYIKSMRIEYGCILKLSHNYNNLQNYFDFFSHS